MNTEQRIIPVGEDLPPMEPTECPARRNTQRPQARLKRLPSRRADAVRRRFGLLNTFLDKALPELHRSEIAAWVLLYRHAKPDGTVTAAVSDLARRAGCCESAMRRALTRLQNAGWVRRLKRGTLAGGPSIWQLIVPDLLGVTGTGVAV